MANGIVTIQGLQTSLPQGAQQIGPFSIPCSPIGALILVGAASTNVATAVPSENAVVTTGVFIVPTAGISGATYQAGLISAQLSYVNPSGYPTMWVWDPAHIPTNVYCTVSNTAGAYIALQFF